nr:MAG TPA: Protein of unknown function (DUF1366) [Caudoviricetes sp.]
MKLEFLNKSLDYMNGEPYKTRVVLGNSEGAIHPVFFDPKYISKDAGELYKLAMDTILLENFPDKGQNDKINAVSDEVEQAKKLLNSNKKVLDEVYKMSELLSLIAVDIRDGLNKNLYLKLAKTVRPLTKDQVYSNNDIVAMPYLFDTNSRWTKGTPTIFKFNSIKNEDYTCKVGDSNELQQLLQQHIVEMVMPRLG